MEEKRGLAWAIGLIASCIAIFVFLTGRQSMWDILKASNIPVPTFAPASTVPPIQITDSIPSPTDTPLPTHTPRPVETRLIENEENYRIEQISNGNTVVEIYLIVPSGFPVDRQRFVAKPVIRDIAGNWQFDREKREIYLAVSSTGIAQAEAPSGNYLLALTSAVYENYLSGWWGNTTIYIPVVRYQGILFSVQQGWTTSVTLTISRLEIGVLDSSGTNALPDISVKLFCQGQDVAGKIVPDPKCEGGPGINNIENTDSTGVATFFVGPGTYFIEVEDYPAGTLYGEKTYLYDIQVLAGETKRTIINYQYK